MHAPPLVLNVAPQRRRRFFDGDWARVSFGCGCVGRIVECRVDPMPADRDAVGYLLSARYRLSGHLGWLYDWQLEPTRPTLLRRLRGIFE